MVWYYGALCTSVAETCDRDWSGMTESATESRGARQQARAYCLALVTQLPPPVTPEMA